MRSARQREEHRAALDQRLEQLQAELAGVRPATAERPRPAGAATGPEEDPWRQGAGSAGTRVRRAAPPAPDPAAAPEAAGLDGRLPVPGRHAARRSRRAPVDGPVARAEAAAPEAVRPAVRWVLTPGHLRVVALLVLVALLASGWWLLRSRPEAEPREVGLAVSPASPGAGESRGPERPGDTSRGSGAAASTAAADRAPDPAEEVVVHVAGRVRRPGIVRLPGGARVVDAVEAAGGARPGVRSRGLNLARALVDGEQVLVGMPGATPAPAAPGPAGGAPGGDPGGDPGAPVDLNAADQAQLETLPGVGPVTAGKILAWRQENGRFSAVEELLEVDGIGEVTLADLAPLVTV